MNTHFPLHFLITIEQQYGGNNMLINYYALPHEINSVVITSLQSLGHTVTTLPVKRLLRVPTIPVDVVIVKSYRKKQKAIADMHINAGIPVLILDWGYFDRVNKREQWNDGHWQISHNCLNGLPTTNLSSLPLRFHSSLLTTRPERDRPNVLLCGQMPQDAAVIYGSMKHSDWLMQKYHEYTSAGFNVVYREHPRGGVKLDKLIPTEHISKGRTLDEDLEDAQFVICYNSNVGHDALLAGIPVVCDPCAPYYELSGEVLPSEEQLASYFNKAAYGQWKAWEFTQGLSFALDNARIELNHYRKNHQQTERKDNMKQRVKLRAYITERMDELFPREDFDVEYAHPKYFKFPKSNVDVVYAPTRPDIEKAYIDNGKTVFDAPSDSESVVQETISGDNDTTTDDTTEVTTEVTTDDITDDIDEGAKGNQSASVIQEDIGVDVEDTSLDIFEMTWHELRAHVKEITGTSPKNKAAAFEALGVNQ
jgi:hypothetical protein